MTVPAEEEFRPYRSRPRRRTNRSKNSAWDQIRSAYEEFVSRTGNHFVVPDIGRIDLGAKIEFSADMRVSDGAGRTQTLRLNVGNMRARFDLLKQENDASGIGSILIDLDHQSLYLLLPQANLYLQIEGSAGTPSTAEHGCSDLTLRKILATTEYQRPIGVE